MFSSGANLMNGDDSTLPGDYEPFSASGARGRPFGNAPPQPMIPPARTPFPRLPPAGPAAPGYPGRTPFPRLPPGGRLPRRRMTMIPAQRPRRHRRRPLTPEIVIDRRHSSRRGRRVITIPLDHRPTLGLRGPPRRCIEIESVRCHRRRRPRSVCYEYDDEYDEPPRMAHPQSIMANPIANSFPSAVPQPSMIVPANNPPTAVAATTAAFLSNLTPEAINNLPRQTVHLPSIHLPGSQADANTELDTVIFPAEIINPIDGTLSIIQANPAANQGIVAAAAPSPLIQMPANVGMPVAPRLAPISPAMAADPLMQRFQEVFQRLSFPQTQPASRVPNPPVIRPTPPNISQFNPANYPANNPPIIPSFSTANAGGYPRANIQPTNPLNMGSYRPASVFPTLPSTVPPYRPTNLPGYRPSTFTPSGPISNPTYRPPSIAPTDVSDIGPYRPANITPYANTNYRPPMSSGPTPYSSAPLPTSTPRTPFPRPYRSSLGADDSSLNPSFSSSSVAPTNSMPKSILRNSSSTTPATTGYARLNSPNVLSFNDVV